MLSFPFLIGFLVLFLFSFHKLFLLSFLLISLLSFVLFVFLYDFNVFHVNFAVGSHLLNLL